MKKNLEFILLGVAAFFGVMIFVFMALPGLVETLFGSTTSVYKTMSEAGGIVVAFIFMILAFLVAACLLTFKLLAKFGKTKIEIPFAEFICLGVALLAFVAFILFWFIETMYFDGNTLDAVKLGVGTVLCALSSLFVAASLGCYGVMKVLKKL